MKTLLKVSGAVGTAWLLYYAGVLVGGGVACAVFDKRDGTPGATKSTILKLRNEMATGPMTRLILKLMLDGYDTAQKVDGVWDITI